jgi:hypothetical protein
LSASKRIFSLNKGASIELGGVQPLILRGMILENFDCPNLSSSGVLPGAQSVGFLRMG